MTEQVAVGLSLVVVRVRDLDVSRSFYESIGLVLRPERHGDGPVHLSADLDGVVVELYPQGPGPSSAGTRLGLRVPNLSRAVASLEPTVVRTVERDGQLVALAEDPDGHKIELTQRP